jgi:ASC-1-like (ASCH) protein
MDWDKVAETIRPLTETKIECVNAEFKIIYPLPKGSLMIDKNFNDWRDNWRHWILIFKVANYDVKDIFYWTDSIHLVPRFIYDIFAKARAVQNEPLLCPSYIIGIQHKWFRLLQEGFKTIEGKKGSPKWNNIVEGDRILFECEDCLKEKSRNGCCLYSKVTVTSVSRYHTVREYLEQEGLSGTLPGVASIEEGIKIYESAPISWTKEEIEKYGVMAIHVKPC